MITEHAAVDTELGVLKTGKEADVHLLERAVPGTDRRALLAAKRYRTAEHRMFHRDAGYLEGRRVRRSREMRAMANRTAFGRDLLAGQWAAAEFAALARLWADGVAGALPGAAGRHRAAAGVRRRRRRAGRAAAGPAAARTRTSCATCGASWSTRCSGWPGTGLTHGDLSAYNLLVHDGRLVLIDLPQVVDVVGNPQGPEFLARDVRRIAEWFAARGLPPEVGDAAALLAELRIALGMRGWPHDVSDRYAA